MNVSLESLVGEHMLDAVDMSSTTVRGEDCNSIHFRLDGKVFTGTEDPDDGYRSSLEGIFVSDRGMSNVFEPIAVTGAMKGGNTETLQLFDKVTGKVVLEVGTDNTDDYYPWFVGAFWPENMTTNQEQR